MNKPVLIFCACLLSTLSIALANGGGYYRGGVETAGDVTGFEPSNTENVRILDEKLTVLLGPRQADVVVHYRMRNETKKKVTVRFGFPVEESFDEDVYDQIPGSGDAAAKPQDGKSLKYCRDYQVMAAGKPLDAKWQGEVKDLGARDQRLKGVAGWLVSELDFGPGEEKPVTIQFKSDYPQGVSFISDRVSDDSLSFKYRLSTAACWAGTIGKGEIVLKPNGIRPEEVAIIKPVNRFKKEGDAWIWRFEDLDPTLADDFEVEAVPATRTYTQHVDPNDWDSPWETLVKRGKRWEMAHTNYSVKASSTKDGGDYKADNIKGYDRDEWREGAPGPGTGEWLEITPEVPKELTAVSLSPGGDPSEKDFLDNPRPRKVHVELNGEHGISAEAPPMSDEIEIPVVGYDKPVKTVRLTFEEVWPGKRSEDLSISLVRLHVRLDREPRIHPIR